MTQTAGGMRRVDGEEVVLAKAAEIVIAGDPGCTGFDADSKRILGEIFSRHADAFIILGDMAYRGTAAECDAFITFCNEAAHAPIFTVCGNHDLPGYPSLFGRSTYALIAGSFVFLCVDNVTDRVHFDRQDLAFIAQQLDKHADKRFIILFHIPPPTDLSPKHMQNEKWCELKAVLDPHKGRIECLVCGHIHGFRDHDVDGYRVIITGGGGAKLHALEKDVLKAHHAVRLIFAENGTVTISPSVVGT